MSKETNQVNYQNQDERYNKRAVRVYERMEIFVPVAIFVLGLSSLAFGYYQLESYWESLFISLGSNLIIFEFLYLIYKLFLDRSPGEDDIPRGSTILDEPPQSPTDSALVMNKPVRVSKRRR